MTPRPEDQQADLARRAAIRDALIVGGQDPSVADRWCDAWDAEAAMRGVEDADDYWDAGKRWIDAQCAARKQPPN
jgi:hypothetical protein